MKVICTKQLIFCIIADMEGNILIQYAITFGWALVAAISMAVSVALGIKVFNFISPLDEWEEIKNGNLGMALILSSLILGMAFVVAWNTAS